MLSQGIKFFICINLFLLLSCNDNKKTNLREISSKIVGEVHYNQVYESAVDSLNNFHTNCLPSFDFLKSGSWFLDSLICFNSNGTRCVMSILYTNSNFPEAKHDGLQFFYGEQIKSKWFFFKGENVHIPREMVKNHDIHIPLSYHQLHEIALKEIFSPYLNKNGEINEEWFIHKFEGAGWGDFNNQKEIDWFLKGKRFTNKTDFFQYLHLQKTRNNWLQRDTTQPIKQLPAKEGKLP